MKEYMSEAEALEEWSDEGLEDIQETRRCRNILAIGNDIVCSSGDTKLSRKMKKRYAINKEAKIGSEINCACCGKSTIKTTYHKMFCSNGKTKKKGNCKDRYWNTVDEDRRYRASLR